MISHLPPAMKSLCWPLTLLSSPLHWLAICLEVVIATFSTVGQRWRQEQTAVEDPWENGCQQNETTPRQVNYAPVFVGIEEDVKKTRLEFGCAISFSIKTWILISSRIEPSHFPRGRVFHLSQADAIVPTHWCSLHKLRGFLFIFKRFPISENHSRR